MEQTVVKQNRLVTALIVIITIIGLILIASDWEEMRNVLLQSDWHLLFVAVLFTFLSYAFYSYAYAVIAKTLGIQMCKRELAEVCFISTVVNHVLTTGGVVGYSLRYLMMKMYDVSLREVLTSSFLHYYITSLDMLTFLPLSIFYLITQTYVPRGIIIALAIMTIIFGFILLASTALVIFPSRRRLVISMVLHLGRKILRREWKTWLIQFDDTLTCGTDAFKTKPIGLIGVVLLTLLDFFSSIVAMGFVFEALGPPLKIGTLITGYVVGIMAGLLSMIPGGLGVQEGSMASIYALLGVTFRQAVLAAILFRLIYYFMPYLLILPFYNRFFIKAKRHSIQNRGA